MAFCSVARFRPSTSPQLSDAGRSWPGPLKPPPHNPSPSRTPRGDAAAEAASRAIADIERRWREELGAARFDIMKQALRDLGRHSLRVPAPLGAGAAQWTNLVRSSNLAVIRGTLVAQSAQSGAP